MAAVRGLNKVSRKVHSINHWCTWENKLRQRALNAQHGHFLISDFWSSPWYKEGNWRYCHWMGDAVLWYPVLWDIVQLAQLIWWTQLLSELKNLPIFYPSQKLLYSSQQACSYCDKSVLRKQKYFLEELTFFLSAFEVWTLYLLFSRNWGCSLWNSNFREMIVIRREK